MVEDVSEAQIHAACGRLRFAEGLRRRWEEARAEAAVQEAANLSLIEGGRVSADEIREMAARAAATGQSAHRRGTSASVQGPADAYALGIFRAAWQVERLLPPLNVRSGGRPEGTALQAPPAVLAQIHRDVCGGVVAGGYLDASVVAMPTRPAAIAEVIGLIRDQARPAIIRAAAIWELIADGMFQVGSTPTAVLFSKWFLAREGVEPTGVAILSTEAARHRGAYAELLRKTQGRVAEVADREPESVIPGRSQNMRLPSDRWRAFVKQSVIEGCVAGEDIARSVQAGVFPR